MGNGVFDKVNAILQQEKTLGKLAGVPDVDAYRQIAEYLHKNGDLRTENDTVQEIPKVSSKTEETKQASADRDKKRKAVAPVKQTTTKKAPTDDNFLGLSDEEFMKKYAVR